MDEHMQVRLVDVTGEVVESERKIGRPTKRTPELVESLLRSIEEGKMLAEWCRVNDVHRATVHRWLCEDEGLSRQVARAREVGDSAREDLYEQIAFTVTAHEDDVQHRRLMMHAIEQRLRWSNPARYGTKVALGGAADLPPVNTTTSNAEVASRIETILAAARARRGSAGEARP
jgi:hypothetical protein